jgi:phage shock protein A
MSEVNQAMESAERHTRELEAKADAVDELVDGGIISRPGESPDDAEQRRFDTALGERHDPELEGHGDGPQQISQ